MAADEIARIQARLAYFWSFIFAFVLFTLVWHPPTLDEFAKGIVLTMLGYLGALVQQHSSYFFARHRPTEPPPGDTTTVSKIETVITPAKIDPTKLDPKVLDPTIEIKE